MQISKWISIIDCCKIYTTIQKFGVSKAG